jgi:metal-responsive CopG/Arc/MetJ family transcriptional regulator
METAVKKSISLPPDLVRECDQIFGSGWQKINWSHLVAEALRLKIKTEQRKRKSL